MGTIVIIVIALLILSRIISVKNANPVEKKKHRFSFGGIFLLFFFVAIVIAGYYIVEFSDWREHPTPEPKHVSSSVQTIVIKNQKCATDMESLDLSEYNLTDSDIEPLKYMTNLTWLSLDFNEISDLSILENLNKLECLYLRGNQIRDIGALSGLTSLKKLDLSENQISDISALSKMSDMQYLVVNDNQIKDLSALSNMEDMEFLNLCNNKITDIESLLQMIWIQYLDVRGNKLSQAQQENLLFHLKKSPTKRIYYDRTLESLY